MKKATKLLLSVLPISSVSFLSVVSCSTTSSNAKEPDKKPEKPNENTPIIPKKPDDKKPNNKPGSNTPSENKDPSKPDKTPKTPDTNPKQPENDPKKPDEDQPKQPEEKPQGDDSNNNVQPHNDQPTDKPEINKVDFSDLDKIKTELSYKSIKLYADKDPRSAWFALKNDLNSFSNLLYREYENIKNKYTLSFENDIPTFDFAKGLIDKVQVKFTKDKEFKILSFTLTGFKITKKVVNNKEKYIKEKSELNSKFKGLYPSLVAFMLMYAEDSQSYKTLEQKGKTVGFDELNYPNNDLFGSDYQGINQVTKKLLLDYDYELSKLYKDKIIEAKYDDINGTLGLKIEISNIENNPKTEKESALIKEFNIKGFRSIDFKNEDKNVLSFILLQNSLKEMVQKGSLKKTIELLKPHNQYGVKIPLEQTTGTGLKDEIFKYLLINIFDNSYHIYNSTQSLSLLNNSKNDNKSILGLAGSMSIYPFHTRITKESIDKIFITINKEEDNKIKVILDFEIKIPIYSVGYSDLKSPGTGASTPLVLKINSSALID
ncbi:LppA family lipoprotein [Mycoplasma mycoides]|uniref:LppA family lipoprotein n=1 Tax=Mycoplasma mycoides TaxID=2102 RepID=UPI00223F3E82|nr:LppA family lipoprotein [Mycoplasma mycoides]QVK02817.1 LppA family lipoprotein [Mycoplasma mycoides subsp. capri]QVK03634.1 LppA family lipoprotein [Mycoplasma mycoides subsp. capri]